MTLHLHHLTGCAPVPLAHYLKALGILRIVGEQKDREARGWWQDEHFCLLTRLDRAALETFILDEYAPTPVFNPWGARSGFYSGSPEKTARIALEKIESSSLSRVADFQSMIRQVRLAVDQAGGKKPDTDESKSSLITRLRKEVRGTGEEWLSAVMTLVGEDYRAPALIGTGGNEGSRSYTSAYLSAVVLCVLDRSLDHALGLFGSTSETQVDAIPAYSWSGSFGQFLPDGDASAWDFLLAIEGTALFRSTVALRSDARQAGSQRFLASPFYFAPHAAGSGSSATMDEFSVNKGRRNPGRGEQWFPLWGVPARLAEVETMLSEGRCSVGRHHAGRALDAARAINRLGVARGITAFLRYGYLQRNNMATHFAVPLGRVVVRDRQSARLVDDVALWLNRLRWFARDKHAPARLDQAERRLADAVFAVLTHDDSADRWQAVLLAAAAVEAMQVGGTGFKAGPIPALAPEWVVAADDGSVEFRLARALGSAASSYDRAGLAFDPVRHNWLPLQKDGRRFQTKEKRLLRDSSVVISGRDPVADLSALVERRLIEAAQSGQRNLPLVAASGCGAHPADLAEFIAGNVDLTRVSALARAFMAVRWDRWQSTQSEVTPRGAWPDEAWMALRLACLPWKLDDNRTIPVDDSIVRRLIAGDGATAVEVALRRLRAAGLRPPLQGACADPATAHLWAAALAFPINLPCARAMARHFEPNSQKEIR